MKVQKKIEYEKQAGRRRVEMTLAFVLPHSSANGISLASVKVCTL